MRGARFLVLQEALQSLREDMPTVAERGQLL